MFARIGRITQRIDDIERHLRELTDTSADCAHLGLPAEGAFLPRFLASTVPFTPPPADVLPARLSSSRGSGNPPESFPFAAHTSPPVSDRVLKLRLVPEGAVTLAGGEVAALVKHGAAFKLQVGDRLLDFARITIIE